MREKRIIGVVGGEAIGVEVVDWGRGALDADALGLIAPRVVA